MANPAGSFGFNKPVEAREANAHGPEPHDDLCSNPNHAIILNP